MKQSKLFYKTAKEAPKEAEIISHKLLTRADFISQLASGVYSFLPLGFRVYKKIENIIRQEINETGAQEVFLPSLQPEEIWIKTGRLQKMDPPLFKIKDRHDKEFVLGSTHEEVITDLAQRHVQSYKDLPFSLYQFQTKFRNEMRFTGGLLRAREFMMKDLYSFHADKEDLENYFNIVLSAYEKIFKRCGLNAVKSEASGGVFTKEKTYEFQVLSEIGEDKILFCKKCAFAANLEATELKEGDKCPVCSNILGKVNSIELGHTFRLGKKYSEPMNLFFRDKDGARRPVLMGCYGIGLGRLMASIVELNNDKNGIIWPDETAPFQIHLVQIETEKKIRETASKIYQNLQKAGLEVLYDDREGKSAGEKFAEADLIGIPVRAVVSSRTLAKNSVELKKRTEEKSKLVKIKDLLKTLKKK